MLFVLRGSIILDIMPQLVFTTCLATLVTFLHGQVYVWKIPLTFVPFSLIGLTLAIFLAFRNSTSYARYWEARNLWGSMLTETCVLTRQALTLVDDKAQAPIFVHRLIAFVHALRHQLRGTDPSADFDRLLLPEDRAQVAQARYKPAMLLLMAGQWLGDRRKEGSLEPALGQAMEAPMGRLTAALGGCERIANTPIPFTYAVIIHRTIYLYCFLLPFGLVDSIGVMTPVIVAFVAYTFFALEALGAQIEEPFGTEQNDLALDAISTGIEATLLEALGETDLPRAKPAVNFVQT